MAGALPAAEIPDPPPPDHGRDRAGLYARLLDQHLDLDGLHDLLVTRGEDLLAADVPYLIVAARNRARSSARRDRRRVELQEQGFAAEQPMAEGVVDPLDAAIARSELADVIHALAKMDQRSSWTLWWHAAGFDDDEIISMWDQARFLPANPTPAAIRKRRERTRQALRKVLRPSTS